MIKAIDTPYRGYLFRSRLEARWAVFLDGCNEEWEYEKEGYQLPSGWYLPDFWLPRLGCWLEIKASQPTEQELQKCVELAHGLDTAVAIAWGLPNYQGERLQVYCGDGNDGGGGVGWWSVRWGLDANYGLCIDSGDNRADRCFWSAGCGNNFPGMMLSGEIHYDVSQLLGIATTARFEHGATPNITRQLHTQPPLHACRPTYHENHLYDTCDNHEDYEEDYRDHYCFPQQCDDRELLDFIAEAGLRANIERLSRLVTSYQEDPQYPLPVKPDGALYGIGFVYDWNRDNRVLDAIDQLKEHAGNILAVAESNGILDIYAKHRFNSTAFDRCGNITVGNDYWIVQ